ncbi:hypothetical protein PtA15_1A707 [Puccinia triticina]|uniref:Uncharacterized protein n=1 Tax=Puccinia triticina TaxID=208348 RepID=A0ABY7CA69_9BASI|nr:uncharacterized protein PtA15_1A707 [Puccinia triticina]WAQ81367.1 hypothetical protein PtA15_1A707 [Puccinia triticina]
MVRSADIRREPSADRPRLDSPDLRLIPSSCGLVAPAAGRLASSETCLFIQSLAALKQLTTTTELKVVCFEARSGPAGVWNLESTKGDGRVGFDRAGVPSVEPPPIDASPVYAGLHTNVPKQLMAFHGQPFVTKHPARSFPPGHKVSTYLLEAARGLEPLIRFNSLV